MKRLVIVIAALSLASCAQLGDFIAGRTPNPVTQSRLDSVESTWGIALSAAAAYKDTCVRGIIPRSCRDVVQKMQIAAVPVQSAIVRARAYAKQPTIGATDLIEEARQAVEGYKTLQTQYGVK